MHRRDLVVNGLVLLVAGAALAAEAEVKLATTSGTYVRLSETFRGKPAILFYEDRGSMELNQGLKDALFDAGKRAGMLDAVSVVAIANVQAYDWLPARGFVVAAVKKTEKAIGVPVYLDWTGELTRAPWSLKPDSSTVVVLDREGAVRWAKQGRLSAADRDAVLQELARLVGR